MIGKLLLLLFSAYCGVYALEEKQIEYQLSPTGTIGFSIHLDSKSVFVHCGGPGIGLRLNSWSIRYQLFPSIRWYVGERSSLYAPSASVVPILGAGFVLQYKQALLMAPAYYLSPPNLWILSVGVGVSF
ncbi:MAG: hypothetical protein NZ481_07935 [Candidatus Kapabacteria bacterium]|nr:hypothetical protein [Candidatus Kapabacteria bacterium]